MLNTKYVYQFTDMLQQPRLIKVCRYMENHKYFESKCRLDKLFKLLYNEPYLMGRIRPFKVVLKRNEVGYYY